MTTCPRCQQSVNPQAVNCPHCGNQLKAFGHPGIPLHQATDGAFLCSRCLYDQDNTCNYPQRPYAKNCTLFHDQSLPLVEETSLSSRQSVLSLIQAWLRHHQGLIILCILVTLSIILALH